MPETIAPGNDLSFHPVRLSAQEAADKLGCGVSYVYALIQMERIRHFWTRGRVYIMPEQDGSVHVSAGKGMPD